MLTAGRIRLRDDDAGVLPVLAKAMRVTRPADFTAVLRSGRRAGTKLLTLHLSADATPSRPGTAADDRSAARPSALDPTSPEATVTRPARAGLVVSAAVGNSVVRHRVSRRLREQVRPLLATLPTGTDVVIRASPAAATATSEQLARDLRSALHRARSR